MFFPLLDTNSNNELNAPQQNASNHSWGNIAAIIVIIAIASGTCCSFGAFFTPLKLQFGWDIVNTSALFSIQLLFTGLSFIAGIWAVRKYVTKPIVFVLGAIIGFSLLLSSLVDEGWQLFVTYGIVFAVVNGAITAIVISICCSWFNRKPGYAIGIISIGAGLGIFILLPITAWLLSEYGWPNAFRINGIIAWCLIMPASFFLKEALKDTVDVTKDSPMIEDAGTTYSPGNPSPSSPHITTTLNALLSSIILFSYSFCFYTILCHFLTRLDSMDFSMVSAGATLGLMGGAIVFSRLMIGFSVEALPNKSPAIIFVLLHAITLFWLVDSDAMWMFYLFAVVFGATLGGIDLPIAILLGIDMSRWKDGKRLIFVLPGWFLGAAAGPVFSGWIIQSTSHYEFVFFFGGMLMALAAACIWGIKPHQTSEEVKS